jgi:uncharacterized membrane protein
VNGLLGLHYKIHWHVILVHFPISFFGAAFLFQILHLIFTTVSGCFTLGTSVLTGSGAIAMIPTTISGWTTRKRKYKGASTPLFKKKITTAFVILGLSFSLIVWRSLIYSTLADEPFIWQHYLFLFGSVLLITGAVIEGYYGGKLTHRD